MSADAPQASGDGDGDGTGAESHKAVATSQPARPLRMRTHTAEIDSTIIHPGPVKINVKGAFIVDRDSDAGSPHGHSHPNGPSHETKDIRLPNHTAVVSHIAVDVGAFTRNRRPV